MASGMEPEVDEVLADMSSEVGVIRACLDDFVGGFKFGETAQASQAKVVGRVQAGLERLAALGSANSLQSVPAIFNDIFERGDRPAAVIDCAVATDQYEALGSGLDAFDRRLVPLYEEAEKKQRQVDASRKRIRVARGLVNQSLKTAFPALMPNPKRQRPTGPAARADAILPPDTAAVVTSTHTGKLLKMLKISNNTRKAQAAATLSVAGSAGSQAQQLVVVAPSDGIVSAHHAKEGESIEKDQPLLTVSVNALVQYVTLLRKTPNVVCILERASPLDSTTSSHTPGRFVLVVGVQGTLTCRIAISRYAESEERGGAKTAGGGDQSAAATPASTTATPKTPATPAMSKSASNGDVMMMDSGSGDNGDMKSSGKSSSGGCLTVSALSVSGVTELVSPWEESDLQVFQSVNDEAYAALHYFRSRTSVTGEVDSLLALVSWIAGYKSLFSAKCVYCNKILSAESTLFGQQTYLPPTGRHFEKGFAYHPHCCPVSTGER